MSDENKSLFLKKYYYLVFFFYERERERERERESARARLYPLRSVRVGRSTIALSLFAYSFVCLVG